MNKGHKFQNQEMYVKVKDFVVKAYTLLSEKIKQGDTRGIFLRTMEDISIDEDGRLSIPPPGIRNYYQKTDLTFFIWRHENKLKGLPEFKSMLKSMFKDEIISKHLKQELFSPFGGITIDESNIGRIFLHNSIDEKKPFQFNQDIFDSAYREIESYFYSKTVTRRSICLLLGFDSETEEINLSDKLKIRKVSKSEIVELWRTSGWFRGLFESHHELTFKPLKYVLELSVEAPKIAANEELYMVDPDIEFEKVISALRLFKKGWIDYPFIVDKVTPTLTSEIAYSKKHSKGDIAPPLPKITYNLSKDEVESFKKFYKSIEPKIDCSKIHLKRFNETYRRMNNEDKLIDYMISFESLYLAGGYKLSHRVSLLLYKDETETKQTFLEIKKAWHVRSKIVHGGKIESINIRELNKEYSLPEFVQKIEEHLRFSIRLFLEKPKPSWINLMFKKGS